MDSFFPTRLSLPLYIVFLIPLAIITDSYQLLLINIMAGGVAVFVFKFWGSGWQQFMSALLVFFAYLISDISFHLISEGSFEQLSGMIFKNYGMASILMVASYPLVFLFEKIFGFVSLSRLRDLADTGNKALLELFEKAPGTMQHSLQVANLAEMAARNIGANALFCRVELYIMILEKLIILSTLQRIKQPALTPTRYSIQEKAHELSFNMLRTEKISQKNSVSRCLLLIS